MLRLIDHGFSATLHPAHGGLVSALDWTGPDGRVHPLLHAPANARPGGGEPSRFGLWPLVPFANRAFGGRLRFGTEIIDLPLNAPDGRSSIHGFGWQSPWRVAEERRDRVALVHSHEGGEGRGPWTYEARLDLSLSPGHGRIALAVTNTGRRALPFGIGLHPWFPRTAGARFQAEAAGALALGEGYRPTGPGPRPSEMGEHGVWTLPPGRELAASIVDWDGAARLDLPERGLSIRIAASDSLRHPVLWSPPDADFLCFEPQSHGIGAPSEAAAQAVTPMAILQPGETLAGFMDIRPAPL